MYLINKTKQPLPLLFLFIAFLGLWPGCTLPPSSDAGWPAIAQETRPWTRWWWHGSAVTQSGITAELEALKAAGIGGVELTPIFGVIGEDQDFIPYLSPQWMGMLDHVLAEAKRLDLGVDMATGTGWPFGGPWVGDAGACKYMADTVYYLKAGQRLNDPIFYEQKPILRVARSNPRRPAGNTAVPLGPYQVTHEDLVQSIGDNEDLQGLALDQVRFKKTLPLIALMAYSNNGQILDLKEKVAENGLLDWTAPEGEWKLYALFQGLHGKMVERAAPGGEGNVIDHFSGEAIQHYLQRFDSAFAGHDISYLRAFFNDSYEVDDARGQSNWTDNLLREFNQRRGYDLRTELPALLGKTDPERNVRVRSDYRETISDLLLDQFTLKWSGWAKNKGAIVRNQSHGSPAHVLDLYAASDIPETEGEDLVMIKYASSAANVSGKKLVASESATWLQEHFLSTLAGVKQNLDNYFLGGVNHIFYHGTAYSPAADAWPGRLFYAAVHFNTRNPFWKDLPTLNAYVTRIQSFLQNSKPDNDILLYFPIHDHFAFQGPGLLEHIKPRGPSYDSSAHKRLADELTKAGYSFDYISDRQLQDVKIESGKLSVGNGRYKAVVVPAITYMPLQTLQKLKELAMDGTPVVFEKHLPTSVPGYADWQSRQQTFQTVLQQVQSNANVKVASSILQQLKETKIFAEPMYSAGLRCIRKVNRGQPFYFIVNTGEKTMDSWVELNVDADGGIVFDPMTGKTGGASLKEITGNKTEVYLQLAAGASVILVLSENSAQTARYPTYRSASDALEVKGPWSVHFMEGGPELPNDFETVELQPWTNSDDSLRLAFSGTARYKTIFSMPSGVQADAFRIDLGKVANSARVVLNGEELGTLIGPTYQVVVEASSIKPENTLEIYVSNSMANHIIHLENRGVVWKKFYNVNFPANKAENRGDDGLFTAKHWKPLESGLAGPVVLIPLNTYTPE